MVERVARGSILAPAAAAIGAAALGLMKPLPATAGQDTTLQIRVQVVEACQIRLAPGGQLGDLCSWSSRPPMPTVEMPTVEMPTAPMPTMPTVEMPAFDAVPPMTGQPMPKWRKIATLPSALPSTASFDEANRRALGLAQQIAQRVRYVTLTF